VSGLCHSQQMRLPQKVAGIDASSVLRFLTTSLATHLPWTQPKIDNFAPNRRVPCVYLPGADRAGWCARHGFEGIEATGF